MTEEDLGALRQSQSTRTPITLTVSQCLYTCCSRGWSHRDYEASYRGRVALLKDDWLLLMADGLGTITFTIRAELRHVVGIEP